jgi:hypothetical protein
MNKLNELIKTSPYEAQTKFSDTSSHTSRMSAYPKLCARHRVPSVCSSEATSHYRDKRKSRRTTSNGSDLASSVDANEFKSKSSRFYSKKNNNNNNNSNGGLKDTQESIGRNGSNKQLRLTNRTVSGSSNGSSRYGRFLSAEDWSNQEDSKKNSKLFMVNEQNMCESDSLVPAAVPAVKCRGSKENYNRVHFHLNPNPTLKSTDEEDECDTSIAQKNDNHHLFATVNNSSNENKNFSIKELPNETSESSSIKPVDDLNGAKPNNLKKTSRNSNNASKDKNGMEWDNDPYWDNLELNAVGQINFEHD